MTIISLELKLVISNVEKVALVCLVQYLRSIMVYKGLCWKLVYPRRAITFYIYYLAGNNNVVFLLKGGNTDKQRNYIALRLKDIFLARGTKTACNIQQQTDIIYIFLVLQNLCTYNMFCKGYVRSRKHKPFGST